MMPLQKQLYIAISLVLSKDGLLGLLILVTPLHTTEAGRRYHDWSAPEEVQAARAHPIIHVSLLQILVRRDKMQQELARMFGAPPKTSFF